MVVKPQTYMNRSGRALEILGADGYVRASDTLVVCDDIALPMGTIRLRKKGSDGGHNGLRSVIESLGTTRFPRLRLGVGPVPESVDAADFVLEPMPDEVRSVAKRMVREAVKCLETLLSSDIDTAMNRFNRRVGAGEDGTEE
jgi:PTH1 family peptidyl-tRNA hydrolase